MDGSNISRHSQLEGICQRRNLSQFNPSSQIHQFSQSSKLALSLSIFESHICHVLVPIYLSYSQVKITQGRPAELENRSNSLEIKESSPKIPKLHENCIHGVSQFPTSLFRVKKLSEKAVLPSRASALSAGYDLSSAAKTKVPARGKALIPTDLSIAIPQGTYARIAPRSGLAWKHSIDVGAGVIDADYRGPVGVILFNHSNIDFEVNVGDRVAQLIIEKIMTPDVIEVQDLDATPRGDGGFGSTGV